MPRETDAERARLQSIAFGRASTPQQREASLAAQQQLAAMDSAAASTSRSDSAATPASPAPAHTSPEHTQDEVPGEPLRTGLLPSGPALRRLIAWGVAILAVGILAGAAIGGAAGSARPVASSTINPTSDPFRVTEPVRPSLGTGTSPGNPAAAESWFESANGDAHLEFDIVGVDEGSARLVDQRSKGVALWLARTRDDQGYCFVATRNAASEASPHADAACVSREQFETSGLAIRFIGGRATWDGFFVNLQLTGES
ncbi:MAG: hypothetical protein JWO10_592 [Microbacteriaceae bacterium]|nr:hypothetical protein [Microbacteriaceae bacterium]